MELKDARKYRQLEKENGELKADAGRQPAQDPGAGGSERKKLVSPSQKRRAVQGVVKAGLCSERRACRYLGVHRSSHRHEPKQPSEWLLRLHGSHRDALQQVPSPGLSQARPTSCVARAVQAGRKIVQRIRREHGLRVKRWTKRPQRRGRSTGTIPTKSTGNKPCVELGLHQ